MAIDVESLLIDALLSLVEEECVPLERVTVKRILERSGVSRQAFYNHFLDKNDLVVKTYERRIIGEFDPTAVPPDFDFRASFVASLSRMRARGVFAAGAAPRRAEQPSRLRRAA